MLKKKTFYPGQHVAIEDMGAIVDNCLALVKDYLSVFAPVAKEVIFTETVPPEDGNDLFVDTLSGSPADYGTLLVKKGIAYKEFDKLELEVDTRFVVIGGKDIFGENIILPQGTNFSTVVRKDIIGVRYNEVIDETSEQIIDFIDTFNNIKKTRVYTQLNLGAELVYLQGTASPSLPPVDPALPANVLPLARLNLFEGVTNLNDISIDDLRLNDPSFPGVKLRSFPSES